MFKKLAMASLIALVFSKPYAQINVDTTGGTTGGAVTSSPLSNSVSTVGDVMTGASSSSVGDLSTGSSSSQGNISGNTTISTSYATPKIPVATAYSPGNHPTAPCMGSTSIGGSAVLFGFSGGTSWEATECMTFEAARSFDQVGMYEDALAIKCTSKYSAAAPSCIRLQQEREGSLEKTEAAQYEKPQQEISLPHVLGRYTETVDLISGYKITVDTRDSFRRPEISR
jgi:hypothetical protein